MGAETALEKNDATAVNKKDGKSVFKLAFQVKQVNDSDVDADPCAPHGDTDPDSDAGAA